MWTGRCHGGNIEGTGRCHEGDIEGTGKIQGGDMEGGGRGPYCHSFCSRIDKATPALANRDRHDSLFVLMASLLLVTERNTRSPGKHNSFLLMF